MVFLTPLSEKSCNFAAQNENKKQQLTMIQTHLLPLQPPYQIIAAGGHVGLQVATLIVTEETRGKDDAYGITTHSHPVVNYALKQLALDDKDPTLYSQRRKYENYLSPEGAVWDKAEVRDIWVLGIGGVMREIPWDDFMFVVNKNDADWPVEINDRNELWQFNGDMRRVRETLCGLGVSVKRCENDPVVIDLMPVWDADDDEDVDHFIIVELHNISLFAVRMGEVEATAQLIIEGLKYVASLIFRHNSYMSVEYKYKEYQHLTDFVEVAGIASRELSLYENP